MNNNNITNLKDPVNAQDAATQNYVINYVYNYLSGNVFAAVNTFMLNNSLNLNKINFNQEYYKVMCGDGTFKVANASVNQYRGDLTGVIAKLLVIYNDNSSYDAGTILSNLQSVVTSLKGSLTNINITVINLYNTDISNTNTGINASDPTKQYDAILYCDSNNVTGFLDTDAILTAYFNIGTGIVLSIPACNNNDSATMNIVITGGVITDFYHGGVAGDGLYHINGITNNNNHPISYGVPTINMLSWANSFMPVTPNPNLPFWCPTNNITNGNGQNVFNYWQSPYNNVGNRVDLNIGNLPQCMY